MGRAVSGDRPYRNRVRAIPRPAARTFDKRSAFEYALRIGNGWAIGELISDAKGVRVEE